VFLLFSVSFYLKPWTLEGRSQLWTSLTKSSLQPEIKVHLEIRFKLRRVLLEFQSLTEKPVFECAFAHPMIDYLYHIWLKTV